MSCQGAVQAVLQKLEGDPTTLTPLKSSTSTAGFRGSIYEQKELTAMGCPVSAVIANVYLEQA